MHKEPSDSTNTGNEGDFDPVRIGSYSAGNPGFELELVGLFRRQLTDQLQFLLHCTNPSEWKRTTHTIKGAAWAMGAARIAAQVELLESLEPRSDRAAQARLLEPLVVAIAKFECAVSNYFPNLEDQTSGLSKRSGNTSHR